MLYIQLGYTSTYVIIMKKVLSTIFTFSLIMILLNVGTVSAASVYIVKYPPTWSAMWTSGDSWDSGTSFSVGSETINLHKYTSCSHGWFSSCSNSETSVVTYRQSLTANDPNHAFLQVSIDFSEDGWFVGGGNQYGAYSNVLNVYLKVSLGSTVLFNSLIDSYSNTDAITTNLLDDYSQNFYSSGGSFVVDIIFKMTVSVSYTNIFPSSYDSFMNSDFQFSAAISAWRGSGGGCNPFC